jgi:hypothetical protein
MAHRNSLRWHRLLLWIAKGATLNRPAKSSSPRKIPGGIIPLRWAASSRFGGRHHSVTAGAIISFWWAAWIGISNGKAKDAQISIDRIHKVMHAFQGEPGGRRSDAPSRKLWTALHELNGYLSGQSNWLVNYAKRHRAGLRVGTALTEATANFLVNHRMNKSQQMRWTRRGADLLLQVRCAVYNGTLGSGFGQRFEPAVALHPQMALAA